LLSISRKLAKFSQSPEVRPVPKDLYLIFPNKTFVIFTGWTPSDTSSAVQSMKESEGLQHKSNTFHQDVIPAIEQILR